MPKPMRCWEETYELSMKETMSCGGENYDLDLLTNQVGSKYSAHPNCISIKKSETDNLVSFCFGFFLYSSLIFQSLIVRWVLSKLIPIFISRLPSA